MNIKRISVLMISVLLLASLTSCKIKKDVSEVKESTVTVTESVSETILQTALNTESTVYYTAMTESVAENYTQQTTQKQTTQTTTVSATTELMTTEASDDPADWSKERIVEEYKRAAVKSDSTVKSVTEITLKDISVNNGEYDTAMSLVKPIIAKFIESSSTENSGITGGFENLASRDVASAKAYKNGSDTVIEMTMVEQTSGPEEEAESGSVGHAITTVGDISEVVKDLDEMGLPLEISKEDTKLYYTNPTVRVVINGNGEIVSGRWSYTVQICMDNMKAFGQTVEKASITMDNTITV